MGRNIVKHRSFDFAINIGRLFRLWTTQKNGNILCKQLLPAGSRLGAMGRKIKTIPSIKTKINSVDVSDLKPGLYHMSLECDETILATTKFVKQ